MRTKAAELAISVLFASAASGQVPAEQSADRVLHFTHTATVQGFQEIATVMRTVAGIQKLSLDTGTRALAVRGTSDQIALAEWLFIELDIPASGQSLAPQRLSSGTDEYRVPGSTDNVTRVFYLTNTKTVQGIQEIVVAIRTVADISKMFLCTAPRALALRGTASQIALAEWMVNKVDKPAGEPLAAPRQTAATEEYRVLGSNDVVRVFYAEHTVKEQAVREIEGAIRVISEIKRMFFCTEPRAMPLRGTADQIALAEWLFNDLDKPMTAQPIAQGQTSRSSEYRVPATGDVVRVFRMTDTRTTQDLQEIVASIRATANIQQIFLCNAIKALPLRGTSDRIALAERLINKTDRPDGR